MGCFSCPHDQSAVVPSLLYSTPNKGGGVRKNRIAGFPPPVRTCASRLTTLRGQAVFLVVGRGAGDSGGRGGVRWRRGGRAGGGGVGGGVGGGGLVIPSSLSPPPSLVCKTRGLWGVLGAGVLVGGG